MSVDHYENFPVASILMPKRLRKPVAAIYHFARAADDIADEGDLPGEERLRQLDEFRAELARGIYRVRARLVQAPDRHQHHRRVLCRYESDLSFEVIENSIERFSGLFPLPADIVVQPMPADDADRT